MSAGHDIFSDASLGMARDALAEVRHLKKHNADLAAERDELWKRCGHLERELADLRFRASPLGGAE